MDIKLIADKWISLFIQIYVQELIKKIKYKNK